MAIAVNKELRLITGHCVVSKGDSRPIREVRLWRRVQRTVFLQHWGSTHGDCVSLQHYGSTHLLSCWCKWCIEPLLKCAARLEDSWQQEIQQSPQLWEFILNKENNNKYFNQLFTRDFIYTHPFCHKKKKKKKKTSKRSNKRTNKQTWVAGHNCCLHISACQI